MKKIKIFLFAFLMLFSFSFSVKAEDYINEKDIRLVVEGLSDTDQQNAYVRIYNSGFVEGKTYAVTFTKDTTAIKEELSTSDDKIIVEDVNIKEETFKGFSSVRYLPLAEQYGDMYVTFYVADTTKAGYYKKIADPILLEKPANLKISTRFKVSPFEDKTSIYYYNLGSISTERKVNYKLGKVTDKELLKKIKADNYSGFEELLSFAKNDTKNITSGQIKVNAVSNEQPVMYKQSDLVEGAYYYIYLELDSESGKYYKLDDVNLYQCLNNNGKLWLTDATDSRFKWNIQETAWEKFVDYFKKSSVLHQLTYESGYKNVEITSDDNNLNIKLSIGEDVYETKYTHENGIVTYSKVGNKYYDRFFNDIVLDFLINNFSYNFYKFDKYIYQINLSNNFKIDTNGLEYKLESYLTKEEEDKLYEELKKTYGENIPEDEEINNPLIFTSLKVDIVKGAKTYDESIIPYYEFIAGENQKYTVNKNTELKFEVDALFDLFTEVQVDGKVIDPKYYVASKGDNRTNIVLKKEYLDTLKNGVHTLKVMYKFSEFAETEFTIENNVENPDTGALTYSILFVIMGFGILGYFLIKKQSRFPKHN